MHAHTPAALFIADSDKEKIMAGNQGLAVMSGGSRTHEEREANSARLVACWNALRDLTNDQVSLLGAHLDKYNREEIAEFFKEMEE